MPLDGSLWHLPLMSALLFYNDCMFNFTQEETVWNRMLSDIHYHMKNYLVLIKMHF